MSSEEKLPIGAPTPPQGEIRIGGTLFTMKCPRGHAWTEWSGRDQPFSIGFYLPKGDGTTETLDTGPLCLYCFTDLLKTHAGAEIVSSKRTDQLGNAT